MKVSLSIAGLPDAQAKAELFMGSPRGFSLGKVPCGSHKIRIETTAKRRYRLESGSDRIDCRSGSAHHVRLVLIEDRRLP